MVKIGLAARGGGAHFHPVGGGPDAGGGDAERRLRANLTHQGVDGGHQLVHRVPAEVPHIGKSTAAGGEGALVRKAATGIKIVVQMDAVHRIVFQDLPDAFQDLSAHPGLARVVIQAAVAVEHHAVGQLAGGMTVAELGEGLLTGGCRRAGDAVRVEPGVQFHARLVTLLRKISQRVKAAVRGLSLAAGKHGAPGVDPGRIQRVGCGPHLKKQGVHPPGPGVRDDRVGLGFQLAFAEARA